MDPESMTNSIDKRFVPFFLPLTPSDLISPDAHISLTVKLFIPKLVIINSSIFSTLFSCLLSRIQRCISYLPIHQRWKKVGGEESYLRFLGNV